MIETSQWRASIGGFHSRQKIKLESPAKWKQLLTKEQPEPLPESSTITYVNKTEPANTTEAKKVTPIEDTATPTIHIDVANTCCVTLLVGLHCKYIL